MAVSFVRPAERLGGAVLDLEVLRHRVLAENLGRFWYLDPETELLSHGGANDPASVPMESR